MLKLCLAVALVALTLSVQAEDKALLIELPTGVLARDISSSGMVVGGLTIGRRFLLAADDRRRSTSAAQTAEAVSLNGDTIAGTAYDARNVTQAAIWQRAAEWRLLGSVVPNAVPCDELLSSTYDTSDDGKVIVGLAWNGCNFARAFRWEESTGMVDLGTLNRRVIDPRQWRSPATAGSWSAGRTSAGPPRRAMGGRQAGVVHRAHRHHRRGPRRQSRRFDRGRADLRVCLGRRIPLPISRRGSGPLAMA